MIDRFISSQYVDLARMILGCEFDRMHDLGTRMNATRIFYLFYLSVFDVLPRTQYW
jgi:hypothetical protein